MGNLTCCVKTPDAQIIDVPRNERFTSFDIAEEMNGYFAINDTYINLQFSISTKSKPLASFVRYKIQYLFQTLDWVEDTTPDSTELRSKPFGIYFVLYDDDKVYILDSSK
jgi:hypothetical protein